MSATDKLTSGQLALVRRARAAHRTAYAPYSSFQVGAAVRTRQGKLFSGCNVENVSLGAGICAERNALCRAAHAGMRPGDLEAVAVFTTAPEPTPPCGMCLQVLVEFGLDVELLLATPERVERHALKTLLPKPFTHFPGSGQAPATLRRPRAERPRSRKRGA